MEKTKEMTSDFITEDMLVYLDDLRESGVTNMLGATPYIINEYPFLSKKEATDVLLYWMKTFTYRNSSE